jgi:hypothetical protein
MSKDSALEYRFRASALRELAAETDDEERRKLILTIAEHYEQLASSEERIRQFL